MARKKTERGSRGISLIKKSNQLIESRYKFDVWETRFFLAVLSKIRREDDDFNVYRIWYKDVVKEFDLKSNQSYELLRQGAKSLMGKSFFVNYEVDGVEREVQYHILRKIDYLKQAEDGRQTESQEYIDVTVEQEMRPLLLQLQKNFTAYDLRNVRKLGAYPVRIYELLKQYESLGGRTIGVEEVKRMLELTTEYPRFPNFFQKVIQPAVREINKHTDIQITDVVQVKESRRVVALRFVVEGKSGEDLARARGEVKTPHSKSTKKGAQGGGGAAPVLLATTADQERKDALFLQFQPTVVQEFGVSPTVFLNELDRVGEAEIARAIRVTQRARKDGKVKNLPGFFIEAIRKGFTDAREEHDRRRDELQMLKENLRHKLENFLENQATRVSETLRELTSTNLAATPRAIESLRIGPITRAYIENREQLTGHRLELNDFRQDPTLREWVKLKLIEQHPDIFEPWLSENEQQIRLTREEIGRLEN